MTIDYKIFCDRIGAGGRDIIKKQHNLRLYSRYNWLRHIVAGAALTRHAIRAQVVPRRGSLDVVSMRHNAAPYVVSM